MSAMLDETKGFVALAFVGPRSKVWHGDGQSVDDKVKELGRPLTIEEWMQLSGTDFTVEARPLFYRAADGSLREYPDRFANTRTDTDAALGLVSTRYNLVQPRDTIDTLDQIVSVDPRFSFETMGSLHGGNRIWVQAAFAGELTIGGSAHKAKLLASTTFDTTSPTRLQGCIKTVVCDNTIRMAMGEHAPMIDIRHSTKFDKDKAIAQLAKVAEGFNEYKVIGDALASHVMANDQVSAFIRNVLDIPLDATKDQVSTRKQNQRQAIIDALLVSCDERAAAVGSIDAFTALQAITRYVDHTRDADNTENRLFGSGAALKDKALGLLMPMIKDKVAA